MRETELRGRTLSQKTSPLPLSLTLEIPSCSRAAPFQGGQPDQDEINPVFNGILPEGSFQTSVKLGPPGSKKLSSIPSSAIYSCVTYTSGIQFPCCKMVQLMPTWHSFVRLNQDHMSKAKYLAHRRSSIKGS